MNLLRWLLLWMVCWPAAGYGHTQGFTLLGNAKSIRIPIEIKHNIVLIPLRINGSIELKFILDTGVRTTLLVEPLIMGMLHLDSLSPINVKGLGEGPPIPAALARNIRIDIPGAVGKGINMVILPEGAVSYGEMFGEDIYGIIGNELFGQFVMEINYSQKMLVIHDPFRYKPPRKTRAHSIQVIQGKPYMMAEITDHAGKKANRLWLLDTGASQGITFYSNGHTLPDMKLETFLGKGLNGNVYGHLARAQSFEIAGHRFTEPIVGYPDSESIRLLGDTINWYGNIGADILSRFNITFDYLRGQVYFRKNSAFKKPFGYNVAGLEVEATGIHFQDIRVSYVRPGSPAALAGILIGDKVVSVNGQSTAGLDIAYFYSVLTKGNGRKLILKLQRGKSEQPYKAPVILTPVI